MSHDWSLCGSTISRTFVHLAVLLAAPSKGPVISDKSKVGRNQVDLVWTEIPLNSRRGFITNYIIYYTKGTEVHSKYFPEVIFFAADFCTLLCLSEPLVVNPVLTASGNAVFYLQA